MNIKNKRAHSYYRKKLIRQLLENDYMEGKVPRPETDPDNQWLQGPRVDSQYLEWDLVKINFGEARYRAEFLSSYVMGLGIHAYQNTMPQASRPQSAISLEAAREKFFEWLIVGYEFRYGSERRPSYGVSRIIDFEHPKVNRLRVHEAWQGVRDNAFAWDLIISVNNVPLIAVVYGDKGHLLDTARQVREELDADPMFGTYAQILIVTDGHNSYMGTPDDDPEDYTRLTNIFDDVLSPSRIFDMIYFNLRPGNDGDSTCYFVADMQQQEIVQKVIERIDLFRANKSRKVVEPPYVGYVLAPCDENNLRHPSPFDWAGAVVHLISDKVGLRDTSTERFEVDVDDDPLPGGDFAVLSDKYTTADCEKLIAKNPDYHIIRIINLPQGPALLDEEHLGPLLLKIENPIETLAYESGED